MTFFKLNGQKARKSIVRYKIDWDGASRSKFQKSVKDALREIWGGHVVYEEFPIVGTKMTLDFVNLTRKIAIEAQGGQHTKANKFFHRNVLDFIDQVERDDDKLNWCNLNSIRLVEIHYKDWPISTKELQEKFKL